VKKAHKRHLRNFSILFLILLIPVIGFIDRIVIKVPTGHAGVLFHFVKGTITDKVYEEGYHIIFPLHDFHIYDVRKQVSTLSMDVLSQDGLKIDITVSVRFRPIHDSIAVIDKHLGPNYINVVLKPEIESVTRKIISSYAPVQLYQLNRGMIEDQITKECHLEFGEEDLVVDDIMIENIQLPKLIEKAIENKIKEEQRNLEFDYTLLIEKKEAERKLIEAQGIKKFNDTSGISIVVWKGIAATVELSKSNNAKVIVVGNDSKSLPVILSAESSSTKN
jgi:regulator of protease activity HflC (stomatin/prohibitin superfamily)